MSVVIRNDQTGEAAAAQAGRLGEVTHGKTQSEKANRTGGSSEDSVEISSLSERISSAASAQDTQQADRLRQIAALYASGQYQVDPLQLSRALVNHTLSLGRTESD